MEQEPKEEQISESIENIVVTGREIKVWKKDGVLYIDNSELESKYLKLEEENKAKEVLLNATAKAYDKMFAANLELRDENERLKGKVKEASDLLRETSMRTQIALPETEQDNIWWEEGTAKQMPGFGVRLYEFLDLGNLNK